MKIFNARVIKEGQGKFGPYKLIGFKDDKGTMYSSYNEFLLDVQEGADVDGEVVIKDSNGKTYYNFKADKNATTSIPLAQDPPKKPDQSIWDKKDKLMNRMSALKAASTLFEGKGGEQGAAMLDYAQICYEWIVEEKKEEQPPIPPAPVQDEIDVSDVPF